MNGIIFERNILSLTQRNSTEASLLTRCDESDKIDFRESKTGLPVPCLSNRDATSRFQALHSLFDPVKEGLRLSERTPDKGYLICFGLGGAYHLTPLLEKKAINRILIIEDNISIVKSILQNCDLSQLLLDKRVSLLCGKTDSELKRFLLTDYLPIISGDLATYPLNSRIKQNRTYFESVLNVINEVLTEARADFSAQIHYGKRWFVNTLANLRKLENNNTVLRPERKILITAAGPSLEKALPVIRKERKKRCLIATDTTLPFLLKNGIKPDIAISIDCQHITYHHFIQQLPQEIPLVLDLASPRHLTDNRNNLLFFSSGHPLSAYISSSYRYLPELDISGGNVTHAALSLAEKLGAEDILLAGADFSYPAGKPYASGTYIYPYFRTRQTRLFPQEYQLYDFLNHSGQIERIDKEGSFLYKTPSMSRYHHSLCRKIIQSERIIRSIGESGLPLPENNEKKGEIPASFLSHGAEKKSLINFLKGFSRKIEQAAEIGIFNPGADYLALDAEEREIWLPLFPLAAHFKFRYPEGNPFRITRQSGWEWVKRELKNNIED